MNEVLLVISNFPDRASAEAAADALVNANLVACVNILAGCTSVYRWEGKVEHANEVPLLIKTTRAAYAQMESTLRKLHPYELPEIIAVPVTAGLSAYLDWVAQETQPRNIK
ncbi:MAG: periplasmic divalent cation tolerance [Gallionellaceae bacterium]|nr:MAG: periplasmic divalent cation tolerance [Gallionellaceae bacterium]